jgi:hypothetical protein
MSNSSIILVDLLKIWATQEWADISGPFWSNPDTWPGNGSTLFNSDRGIGAKLAIDIQKYNDLSSEKQASYTQQWRTWLETAINDPVLKSYLLKKEWRNTTVRIALVSPKGPRKRHNIPNYIRQEVLNASSACVNCSHNSELQVDHKNPAMAFLPKELLLPDYFQVLCRHCNIKKRSKLDHKDGMSEKEVSMYINPTYYRNRYGANDVLW